MAVAVADAWQHHGIGRALVVSGIDWAAAHGFGRVRAAIRWSNPAILGLLRSIGHPMTVRCDLDSELEALIDITGELPPRPRRPPKLLATRPETPSGDKLKPAGRVGCGLR